MKTRQLKTYGMQQSSSKREVYSNTILPQETRKTSNNTTTKISRRKGIKIQAAINEKEMKETIVKINKTKGWLFEKINKIDKPLARVIKEKRRIKSRNLEMKKERLQQTMQKYKGLKETIMNNCMAIE